MFISVVAYQQQFILIKHLNLLIQNDQVYQIAILVLEKAGNQLIATFLSLSFAVKMVIYR